MDVVERTINKFLESKEKPVEAKEDDIRSKRFLKLPYVGSKCDSFARDLKEHVERYYPQIEFNVAWQAPMKIESFFPFKDRLKDVLDRSCVVYSIHCKTCKKEYIGQTKRILRLRLNEHKTRNESACKKHTSENPEHEMDYDGIKVLDTADTEQKLRVKELLHILDRKPLLNDHLGSQSKYDIKTFIVTKYVQFRSDKR